MKKRGIGSACVIYPMDPANKSSATAVFVKIYHDGSAVVYSGATDLGQGSNTVLLQIASETTGIDLSRLRIITSYNNNYGLRRGSQPRLFPSQSRSC